jgi:hypothetical protein
MRASQIPTKFPIPFANNAVSADINPIPQASQIGITNGAASLVDGFPPNCFLPIGAGGVPPWGRDFNGLLNQISAWVQFADNAGCSPTFDSTFSGQIGGYPQGAVLMSATGTTDNTVLWLSVVDNNTNNPDTTYGGSGAWLAIGWVAGIQNELYTYAQDTGSINALVIAPQPPPASYVAGQRWNVKVANTNTGASTINVTGVSGTATALLGARNILYGDGLTTLGPGALNSGGITALVYDGTEFQIENVLPQNLFVPSVYYVNGGIGNDTYNGLSGTVGANNYGPFKTIQRSVTASQKYNLNGFGVNVNVANGTYTGPVNLTATNGAGTVTFTGNTASPSSVLVQGTGTSAWVVTGRGYSISGFSHTGVANLPTGDPGAGVLCSAGQVTLGTVSFGSCYYGQIYCGDAGSVGINGPITVTGSAASFITCISGANVIPNVATPPTLTFTTSINYQTAFLVTSGVGVIGSPEPSNTLFGTITGAASVTGSRYSNTLNGIINTNTGNVNYLPGSTAGTNTLGGQYN